MAIQRANYVAITRREYTSHTGHHINYTVSVVTEDLTFYPLPRAQYGSASDYSLDGARQWAAKLAGAMDCDVREEFWP